MEREKLESMLIDYIDNRLSSVDKAVIEQELLKNAEAYKLYEKLKEVMHQMDRSGQLEPAAKARIAFEQMLNQEIALNKKTKTIYFQPIFYRVAAAVALLIIGGGIGFLVSKQDNARVDEIARQLKEQQLKLDRTTEMMAMMANNQSASQRIRGVNIAFTLESPGDKIVKALVTTMNEDANSNVRLAALEALSNFIQETEVRTALIKSLPKQKDPVVQIALIQLLVKIKEKTVVEDLKRIVEDDSNIQAVKDEAYSGILKLS